MFHEDRYDIGNSLVNMPKKSMLSHQTIQMHHHNKGTHGQKRFKQGNY